MIPKKDFISLADLSPARIQELLDLAIVLKTERAEGRNKPYLDGKTLAMIFQKPSLRTRVSFEMAMVHLGGHAIYLSPDEIKLGQRESIPDAARVLSRYVDVIMARVFAHADILALAQWASVPVVNGLSDFNHPCQGMADLLTIYEKLGRLKGVKLTYVGDGNNVLHSLLFGGAKMGMHIVAATPVGYDPLPEVVQQATQEAARYGGSVQLLRDPKEAVRGADVIYTDTWTSMGQEAEAAERRAVFPPYQVNAELIALAQPNVGIMHCLPAHRGEEITDQVADGPHSWLFDEAENRLHAQKAVLVDLFKDTD
ncbi:MAG: ornithine carbamoyltransferase [Chloroflexi bacterium]|jgi:ornithine carbamoyltransferase|nr:ornithine carbamoyltransferase [Chloroflexota bacterium]